MVCMYAAAVAAYVEGISGIRFTNHEFHPQDSYVTNILYISIFFFFYVLIYIFAIDETRKEIEYESHV